MANEATSDGYLRRLHHDDGKTSRKISKVEGSQYRLQRIPAKAGANNAPAAIVCKSNYVSKFHCLIFRRNRAYWIKDLTSTNGTYLNGHRIFPETERELRFGDYIGVGLSHDNEDNGTGPDAPDATMNTYFIFRFTMFQDEETQEIILLSDGDEDEAEVENVTKNEPVAGSSKTAESKSKNEKPLKNRDVQEKEKSPSPVPPPPPAEVPKPLRGRGRPPGKNVSDNNDQEKESPNDSANKNSKDAKAPLFIPLKSKSKPGAKESTGKKPKSGQSVIFENSSDSETGMEESDDSDLEIIEVEENAPSPAQPPPPPSKVCSFTDSSDQESVEEDDDENEKEKSPPHPLPKRKAKSPSPPPPQRKKGKSPTPSPPSPPPQQINARRAPPPPPIISGPGPKSRTKTKAKDDERPGTSGTTLRQGMALIEKSNRRHSGQSSASGDNDNSNRKTNSVSSASTLESVAVVGGGSVKYKKDQDPDPVSTKTSTSSKRPLAEPEIDPDFHNKLSRKRPRQDEEAPAPTTAKPVVSVEDTSDDSSDSLGHIPPATMEPEKKKILNLKRKIVYFSNTTSEDDDDDDDDDESEDPKTGGDGYVSDPDIKKKRKEELSSKRKGQDQPPRQGQTEWEMEVEQVNLGNYEFLLGKTLSVRMENAILFRKGKFVLIKRLFKTLNAENITRIKDQYIWSLNQNQIKNQQKPKPSEPEVDDSAVRNGNRDHDRESEEESVGRKKKRGKGLQPSSESEESESENEREPPPPKVTSKPTPTPISTSSARPRPLPHPPPESEESKSENEPEPPKPKVTSKPTATPPARPRLPHPPQRNHRTLENDEPPISPVVNGHGHLDLEEEKSIPTPTPTPSPVTPKPSTPKTTMFIHDAPLPRFAKRAQEKLQAQFKQPLPARNPQLLLQKKNSLETKTSHTSTTTSTSARAPTAPPPSSAFDTKVQRREKLKAIGEREKAEAEAKALNQPKKKYTAKVKITNRSRGLNLVSDICDFSETESLLDFNPRGGGGDDEDDDEPMAPPPPPPPGPLLPPPPPPFNINQIIPEGDLPDLAKKIEDDLRKSKANDINLNINGIAKANFNKAGGSGSDRLAILIPTPAPPSLKPPPPRPSSSSASTSSSSDDERDPRIRMMKKLGMPVGNMIKPGVQNQLISPPGKNGMSTFKEPPPPKKGSGSGSGSRSRKKKIVMTEKISGTDIYKRVLKWNVSWFAEERKLKNDKNHKYKEPPVYEHNFEYTSTLKSYTSFDVYFNTYYPLLLLELWATISQDLEKRVGGDGVVAGCWSPTGYGGGSGNDPRGIVKERGEHRIKVDLVERKELCPVVVKPHMKQVKDPKEDWVVIHYHTWIKRPQDMDKTRDLVILTLSGKSKRTKESGEKSVFAYSMFQTIEEKPVGKDVQCDPNLMKRTGDTGFRFSEQIVCKFSDDFQVDKHILGKIRRISYIMPKIREFRALNDLKSFELFESITKPPEQVRDTWTSTMSNLNNNNNNKKHDLIRIAQQLNSDQQSMIRFISDKVDSSKPELMLMHGPPGTGKTATIVALVMQMLVDFYRRAPKGDHRILICTPSNAAVDEITRRLIQAAKDIPPSLNRNKGFSIVRVGGDNRCSKDVKSYTAESIASARLTDKSTQVNIQIEIDSLQEDVVNLREEITHLKATGSKPIQLEAKLSEMKDLETRLSSLKSEKEFVGKRTPSKQEFEDMKRSIIREAHVICSTLCTSANSFTKGALSQKDGTVYPIKCCIIDEASQTTELETLLPVYLEIDKLLLVGDPRQLGATVLSNKAEEKGYGQSLFSRLFKFYEKKSTTPIMMLRKQYRMHPEIVSWPNNFFYEGKLETPNTFDKPLHLVPYQFFNLMGKEQEKEGQIENQDENLLARTLIQIIDELLTQAQGQGTARRSQWSLGVITPYAAQKNAIKNDLDKEGKSFRNLKEIEVDTVDGFQGQEKDIIVLSCVRTDSTGFLKCKNRLNVALTRARHCLYIIGDTNCLSKDDNWKSLIHDAATRNRKTDLKREFLRNDVRRIRNDIINVLTPSTN